MLYRREEEEEEQAIHIDQELEGEEEREASGATEPSGEAIGLNAMEKLTELPSEKNIQSETSNPQQDGAEEAEQPEQIEKENNEIENNAFPVSENGERNAEENDSAEEEKEIDPEAISHSLKLYMQGNNDQIPQEHRAYLESLFADPYVRSLFGEMDEENLNELITHNSPSSYLSMLSMSKLGTTVSEAYATIMGDDFPEELRHTSLLIVAEAVYETSQKLKTPEAVIEDGKNPIESNLDEDARADIASIYENRDRLIQDKLDHQAEMDALYEQELAAARSAVASGTYSPVQMEMVYQNADVAWNDILKDEERAVKQAQVNKMYFSSRDSGFYQTDVYKNLAANGIMDTGSYQSALMREMNVLIDEDTEAALSVNKSLKEFYDGMGGMSLDQLAQRAHLRLQKQGGSVTKEDGEAAAAYGTGVGVLETAGKGAKRGWNEFRLGMKDGLYKGLTIATIEETEDYLRGYYQAMGPYGRSFYRDDLNALIDSGALSEEMADELREGMESAPDIYALGVDPRRFGGMLTDMKERRERIEEMDTTMRENGTEGEYRWYMRISGITTNLVQAGTAAAATAVTGIPTLGFAVGYGPGYYSERVDKWLDEGYSMNSANTLASIDTVGMIAANKAQWGQTFGQITGAGALERAAILDAGMKNPSGLIKLMSGIKNFTKTAVSNIIAEAGTDEFKENLAEKVTEEVFGPFFQARDDGKDVTASDVIMGALKAFDPNNVLEAGEKTAENFKETAITSSILALAGAYGETTAGYRSVKLARDIVDGKSDDFAGLADAVKKDGENPEYAKALDMAAHQAMVDEATVEILARDRDSDGTMKHAKELETEAKEHREQQAASEAAWDAACAEQEEIIAQLDSGNTEGLAQRMQVCVDEIVQHQEEAAEHERQAEEKEKEAGELRGGKLNEARRLAVMEVANETEKARAVMMDKSENGVDKEIKQETGKSINEGNKELRDAYSELTKDDNSSNGITETLKHLNENDTIKKGNKEVRLWYIEQVQAIPTSIDDSLTMSEKAMKAFEARNRIRIDARNMMLDEEMRKQLDRERPNKTFEELIESKMKRKGMSREEAIEDIYKTATKTNADVNQELGLERE